MNKYICICIILAREEFKLSNLMSEDSYSRPQLMHNSTCNSDGVLSSQFCLDFLGLLDLRNEYIIITDKAKQYKGFLV